MWNIHYDENLHKNSFFNKLATNHHDLLVKASLNNWIICVPRAGVLESCDFTSNTIFDHILIPSDESKGLFVTLSNEQVIIKDKQIIVISVQSSSVPILFEETFYIKNLKYSVFCLDKPLFTKCKNCDPHKLYILETLDDCIDYLWSQNLNHVLVKIQKLCTDFVDNNHGFALENLQTQKDLIGSLYSQCLQLVFKNRTTNDDSSTLQLAIETYMQSCLDKTLPKSINTLTCFSDSALNKIVRNYSDLQMKHLNIPIKFSSIVANAKTSLAKINNYSTILDKVNCLKLTFNQFHARFNSDDVLQIFVFLILKLDITNWTSNLIYLTQFRFSSSEVSNESNFLITSLEAALEFIRSDEFVKISQLNRQALTPAFEAIANDDLSRLQELLRHRTNDEVNLCHPLCSCNNCTQSSSDFLLSNEKGESLLMFATITHHSQMVEFLLNTGVQVDSVDYSGKTALHHACLKGHQDILLILINCKASVNVGDHDGNTPLHLACNNGHESCVKALFYTSSNLDIDSVNKQGDTPLHLAIKFNHTGIIRVLLENKSVATIPNRKNQLPIDLAQNYYTERLLHQFHNHLEPTNLVVKEQHGIVPKNLEQIKKIDLLLKAIENNDLPLTCFYLGFSTFTSDYTFDSKCHPLCNCEKCGECDIGPKSPVERINVNTCNIDGFTPLHFAAKHGRCQLLRILLDSGALPNLKTYKTLQTPLHLACINKQVEIVKELVSCGSCELNPRDYKSNTPLFYAYVKEYSKIVEILTGNGANCEIGT